MIHLKSKSVNKKILVQIKIKYINKKKTNTWDVFSQQLIKNVNKTTILNKL